MLPVWTVLIVLGVVCGQQVRSPPRGWNSFLSYTWRINETEFLSNAEAVAEHLLPFGYDTVVIDYLWYQKLFIPNNNECGGNYFYMDEFGRLQPDPARFPSSQGGLGFKPIADKVHSMGLKFGLHMMRGVSQEAVNANTTILGTPYHTGDPGFAITEYWTGQCFWCPTFMAINQSHPGAQSFYDSLFLQFAEWGVDFIKHDCVFGGWYDTDLNGIFDVSQGIINSGRPMVYSLSPGDSTGNTTDADIVHSVVNMYRITSDGWDVWQDLLVHFPVVENFTSLIAAPGLNGLSFPDMDLLAFGWLSAPGMQIGPFHWSNLTQDEQRTEMTLWCMVRSPLMFSGAANNMDDFTLNLLTNPEVLNVQCCSAHNQQLFNYTELEQVAWTAEGSMMINGQNTSVFFVAVFSVGDAQNITVDLSMVLDAAVKAAYFEVAAKGESEIMSSTGTAIWTLLNSNNGALTCTVRDLWLQEDLGAFSTTVTVWVNQHGVRMLAFYNCS